MTICGHTLCIEYDHGSMVVISLTLAVDSLVEIILTQKPLQH